MSAVSDNLLTLIVIVGVGYIIYLTLQNRGKIDSLRDITSKFIGRKK